MGGVTGPDVEGQMCEAWYRTYVRLLRMSCGASIGVTVTGLASQARHMLGHKFENAVVERAALGMAHSLETPYRAPWEGWL